MNSEEDGLSRDESESEVDAEFSIAIPEKYLTDHQCLLEESPPFQALVAPPSPDEIKEIEQGVEQPPVVPEQCMCVLQGGKKKGQICGRKLKLGQTRCGLHMKTCISGEPEAVRNEVIAAVDGPRCPCVFQAGKKKGQICGRKTKPGQGVCGVHTKKCIQVDGEDHVPVVAVEPPVVQDQVGTCPCIYQSGKKKGQVCGRKTKPGQGVCGLHLRTCVQPDVVDEEQEGALEERSPAQREVVELSPRHMEAWAVHRVDEADLDLILSNIDIPEHELPNRDLQQEIYRAVGLA